MNRIIDQLEHAEFGGDVNFLCFRRQILLLSNLVKRIIIICLSWNFVLNYFQFAESIGDTHNLEIPILTKCGPKAKIV